MRLRANRVATVMWLAAAMLIALLPVVAYRCLRHPAVLAPSTAGTKNGETASAAESSEGPARRIEDYAVIWERGLSREAAPIAAAVPREVPTPARRAPAVRLCGSAADPQGGMALLEVDGRRAVYRPGERQGAVVLVAVDADAVLVDVDGERVVLRHEAPVPGKALSLLVGAPPGRAASDSDAAASAP